MKSVKKNWLEWTVFGFSALLIAAVLIFLVLQSRQVDDSPPDIRIEIGTPEPRGDQFAVPLRVRNAGDHTAENVQLRVTLNSSEGPEEAEVNLQFLPRRGQREAWVMFQNDPARGAMSARVLGYEEP